LRNKLISRKLISNLVFGKVYGSFDDFKGVGFLYEPNLSLYKLMFVTYIVLIVNLDPCWIRLGNSSFEVGNNNLHDQKQKKKLNNMGNTW